MVAQPLIALHAPNVVNVRRRYQFRLRLIRPSWLSDSSRSKLGGAVIYSDRIGLHHSQLNYAQEVL
jgi:hypothetical protein